MFTLAVDEITEEGLDLEWEEDRPSIMAYLKNFSRIDFDVEGPLRTKARVWKAGHSVVIQGTVQTVLQFNCVRCLKECEDRPGKGQRKTGKNRKSMRVPLTAVAAKHNKSGQLEIDEDSKE